MRQGKTPTGANCENRCQPPSASLGAGCQASALELAAINGVQVGEFSPNRPLSAESLVFTTSVGTPIDPGNFRKRYFYKLTAKYGLPHIKLHHTRHTAATILKDMGIPIKDAQEILGHTDIKTTLKIYQHGSEFIKRNALTRISNGLSNSYGQVVVNADVRGNCSQFVQSNGENLLERSSPSLSDVIKTPLCPPAYESCTEPSPSFATPVCNTSEHTQN